MLLPRVLKIQDDELLYGWYERILQENRAKLDEIAGYLYDKETISGEEFMRILNSVPRLPADKSGTAAGDAANAAE